MLASLASPNKLNDKTNVDPRGIVMEPVTEAVVGFVMTLAAASYGHFGVTLKAAPHLQHPHVQHSQTIQRLPASAVSAQRPCLETIAEQPVAFVRRA